MLQLSWRQSQLQVEEPKSAIKHGGRETLSFPRGNLPKNRITENTRDAQPQQQAQELKYTIKQGSHTLESQKTLWNRSENTNCEGQ